MRGKITVQHLVAFGVVLAVLVLVACSGNEATSTPGSSDGASLLQDRCTPCHSLNTVEREKLTQEQWQQTVADMVRKGAVLSEEEQQTLIAYLAETYKK
ncbi:MAG: hypothetical protein JXA21_28730 [Anaerolineae bacterium]|nr:hypothetical protein [Anaerolineae bacterium]